MENITEEKGNKVRKRKKHNVMEKVQHMGQNGRQILIKIYRIALNEKTIPKD